MQYGVGVVQYSPVFGQVESNAAHSSELILKAVSDGADLVVLPELCNTGYIYDSRDHAYSCGEDITDSVSIRAWHKVALNHSVYVVAGMNERYQGRSYNTAVLIGPEGLIGVYRKLHLWDKENLVFHKGEAFPEVYALPFANVSMQICYDLWFPEVSRKQALLGADLICVPTNWSPTPEGKAYDQYGLFAGHYLLISNAIANNLAFACADRIGQECELQFLGGSSLIDSTGQVLHLSGRDNEDVKVVQMNSSSDNKKFLVNRRTEFYKI
jgi:N-carbamoylputrescine amidase